MAVPSKGRIAPDAARLVERAGGPSASELSRSLLTRAPTGHFEVLGANTWDIPRFVAGGWADLGITGRDILAETGAPVRELAALPFGHCRLVLAVPAEADAVGLEEAGAGLRLATAHPRLARRLLRERGMAATLIELRGAVEAAPAAGLADGIVDLVATGRTLRENRLRPVTELFDSQAVLIGPDPARGSGFPLERELVAAAQALGLRFVSARVPPGADPLALPISREGTWVGVSLTPLANAPGALGFSAAVPADELDRCVQLLERGGAQEILILPVDRVFR
ncbi:MAG: ATP phosphoribosyltransferase [Thermoplasmata archaeon]